MKSSWKTCNTVILIAFYIACIKQFSFIYSQIFVRPCKQTVNVAYFSYITIFFYITMQKDPNYHTTCKIVVKSAYSIYSNNHVATKF